MSDELEKRATQYAKRRNLRLGRRLGVGMHGMVFEGKNNSKFGGHIALKLHESEIPYRRERVAYERLAELRIDRICGCDVPRALHFDDEFLAIEMTIVQPPYVLDFGSAWLDEAPEFPPNVIEEWVEQKRDQFDEDWPLVERILSDLRLDGIHLLDIHPANIDLRGHPERQR